MVHKVVFIRRKIGGYYTKEEITARVTPYGQLLGVYFNYTHLRCQITVNVERHQAYQTALDFLSSKGIATRPRKILSNKSTSDHLTVPAYAIRPRKTSGADLLRFNSSEFTDYLEKNLDEVYAYKSNVSSPGYTAWFIESSKPTIVNVKHSISQFSENQLPTDQLRLAWVFLITDHSKDYATVYEMWVDTITGKVIGGLINRSS
ncbi:MAG: hypothetical protein PHQ23_00435 [Candidatus Wallbacteria bacterium]|nr:hypothetical protein [Candidatus Wallbacteria bacterium]